MVKEGRIPEEDLLFFLAPPEMADLIDTRWASDLAWSDQNKTKFMILSAKVYSIIDEDKLKCFHLREKADGYFVSMCSGWLSYLGILV